MASKTTDEIMAMIFKMTRQRSMTKTPKLNSWTKAVIRKTAEILMEEMIRMKRKRRKCWTFKALELMIEKRTAKMLIATTKWMRNWPGGYEL